MDIFQRIFLTNMISLETIRQSQTFSKGRSKRTKMSPSSRKMKIFLLLFKNVNIVSRLEVETRHIFTFFENIFKNKLKKFLKVNAILIQNFLHTLKINFYVAHFFTRLFYIEYNFLRFYANLKMKFVVHRSTGDPHYMRSFYLRFYIYAIEKMAFFWNLSSYFW